MNPFAPTFVLPLVPLKAPFAFAISLLWVWTISRYVPRFTTIVALWPLSTLSTLCPSLAILAFGPLGK